MDDCCVDKVAAHRGWFALWAGVWLVAAAGVSASCRSDSAARRPKAPGAPNYLQDARAKLDADQPSRARALLDQARQHQAPTSDADALEARIERRVAADTDNLDQAFDHRKRAADLEPDADRRFADLMATAALGQQLGKPPAQLAGLAGRAVKLKTSSQPAQTLAAHLWDDAGKAGRALPHYQWLHKVSPTDTAIAVRLGTLLVLEDAFGRALPLFRKLHRTHPEHVVVTLKLADIYAHQDDHGHATRLYEQLIADHPEHTGILFQYARYLKAQGDTERAETLKQRARQALPGVKRRKMRKLR